MGIYTTIESLDNQSLFKFLLILVIGFIIFKNKTVKLNIVLGLLLSFMAIYYVYDKNKTINDTTNEEYNAKLSNIIPTLKTDHINNRDIIDLLFSIQDFYFYNPQSFEEMVDNINAIFKIEQHVDKDNVDCHKMFSIALTKKNNAINCLNAILISLPVNANVDNKLIRSHKRLETLLIKRINDLHDICEEYDYKYGKNVNTQQIYLGPTPQNYYMDSLFTFQLY